MFPIEEWNRHYWIFSALFLWWMTLESLRSRGPVCVKTSPGDADTN
jgi:hypothetical protein